MKTVDKKKALDALRYAGLMGHEFVALGADYRISIEASDLEWIKREVPNGTIWQQLPKRQWKQVY